MTAIQKRSAVSDTLRSAHEIALTGDNGRALVNAAETWFSATAECHREMIGFVSMRLEKDNDTFREMLDCKNAADATTIHSRWVEETLRDYNSEIMKLMNIFATSMNGARRDGR
jgi:hypothetical protein